MFKTVLTGSNQMVSHTLCQAFRCIQAKCSKARVKIVFVVFSPLNYLFQPNEM